ncbi:MAG: hypothetical protein WC604_01480 [Candidatus Gracilibacteria bacterium]
MKKISKIASILLISLFSLVGFTACFGGSTDEETPVDTTSPAYSKYDHSDFSVIHPKDWEILSTSDFPSNVPASTVVAFRNNLKNDIFTANLNISQANITAGTTSEDFALQTLNTEKYNLVSFNELSREAYTLGDELTGEKSFIVTFQGRKTITESLVEFKQLCIARNGYGIIITAASLPNEEQSVVMMLDEMLRSFTLK